MDLYTESIKKQLFKIFFSLDIIGNPSKLANDLKTGVVRLFDKPI